MVKMIHEGCGPVHNMSLWFSDAKIEKGAVTCTARPSKDILAGLMGKYDDAAKVIERVMLLNGICKKEVAGKTKKLVHIIQMECLKFARDLFKASRAIRDNDAKASL